MRRKHEKSAPIVATLVVLSTAAVIATFGAGSVCAVHPDDVQDVTENSNAGYPEPYNHDRR